MIKAIIHLLNDEEKSVELELLNGSSTLHAYACSRSILEALHWVWDQSKFDSRDTTKVCVVSF